MAVVAEGTTARRRSLTLSSKIVLLSVGVSAALAYRIVPSLLVGAEAWYLRHYDGAWFNSFTGDAVYVGPTLFVQLRPKMFVAAAWGTQVWGREIGNPDEALNLAEFSRHRAKLKVAVEF